ncbi:major facilitator superfamily transporter [Colletotrichum plurivorum]|uniref:Major facilitator superfamily transporter n=1 Tax=Colletotrichum plurivorum TaxID=2175906 RepID=A0A8H6KU09_9PEZI|nr:major facilitator superfamily transporter [Colletotrichum plurivorum]
MTAAKTTSEVLPAAIDYGALVASWLPEKRAKRERKFVRRIDKRLFPILYTQKELWLRLGALVYAAMISGSLGDLFAAGITATFANNSLTS